VIAEAANPEWVSVPLVGWSLARALAEVADVHLVTQSRNRNAILRAGLREGEDFTALDTERLAAPLWRLGERLRGGEGKGFTTLQAVGALSYPLFERMLWARFGEGLRRGEWDLVHRVTPLSPTWPSPVARRLKAAGVPFVLGPLNGGIPWPAAFEAERRAEKEWLSYVRGAARLLPGRGATFHHAAAILCGSLHTASEVPARDHARRVWLPENAVSPGRHPDPDPGPGPGRRGPVLRAAFVGRLVPYKGPDMALAAAAPLLREGAMTLDLIGDGPMMAALRAQAESLPGVAFRGWLPQEEVARALGEAHLLLFPSIREFGGGVVLEAMASGAAPLVVDYGGPGELVRDGLGWTVPLGPRETIVAALRARLAALAGDVEGVAATGARARAAALADHAWDARARQVRTVYDWVLAGSPGPAPRPLDPPPELSCAA
jgi:glycosyltransferase involved in cell wall biosynthesis